MNDAIFKFNRYEDASLTYTGIDEHTNDEVGGWDTTIRRAQFKNWTNHDMCYKYKNSFSVDLLRTSFILSQ
ncbi:MAG: hypothetical protein IKA86_07120 [Paraprevotella sp.]|nr:hypothetical protein [Paraprevotella sp.]